MRRVVITGLGLITASGTGRDAAWKAIIEGDTSIDRIHSYDPSSFRSQLGGELPDFVPQTYATRRALRLMTRSDQLAVAGAHLAIEDALLDLDLYEPTRTGLFLGGNKEISNPERLLESSLVARDSDGRADSRLLGQRAAAAFYPLFYVEGLQSAALFYISQAHGFLGANAYFHGTADSGATAIGRGFRSIRRGETDLVVAGGFDDATSWWSMSKLDGLGVLSTANDRGAAAFRPYDLQRSGSVLGEGAAFLILEDFDAARRRGAKVYAEITGFGSTVDTERLLTPEPSGQALSVAISRAMKEARLGAADVGYVATHGCATRLGDLSEARALQRVFGRGSTPVASSVKPVTGHLVAAAGALNAAVGALALDSGHVPATLNLEHPDPECAFDWVRWESRRADPRHVVTIARGLEGQQVALALSAVAS